MPDPIERVSQLFEKFPGIGPRQAQRFVQYLLRVSPALRKELSSAIQELGSGVHQCPDCMRYHASEKKLCSICANPARDRSLLAIVASDQDLLALERSQTFRGTYFVLGGTIHLASEKSPHVRTRELTELLKRRAEAGLQEVILALPANPEGDVTAVYVREEISRAISMRTTSLGRGLSTGSELEYADPETIKSALDSRR